MHLKELHVGEQDAALRVTDSLALDLRMTSIVLDRSPRGSSVTQFRPHSFSDLLPSLFTLHLTRSGCLEDISRNLQRILHDYDNYSSNPKRKVLTESTSRHGYRPSIRRLANQQH